MEFILMDRVTSCRAMILFALSSVGCYDSPQAGGAKGWSKALSLQGVEQSVKNTPFTAVVSHVESRRIPGGSDDTIVYTVVVKQVIRGDELRSLTYEMVVEKGESSGWTDEPVILSLCHVGEGYFWPGTGSQFPVTSDLLATAKTAAQNVEMNQAAFDYCE